MVPDSGPIAWRDCCPRPEVIEGVVALQLIIGAVGADLLDLARYVSEQSGQGFGVTDIIGARHGADDFERRLVDAQVEFAPGPALAPAVLTDFPLDPHPGLHRMGARSPSP
jgi:hypothetical protein